VASLDALIVLIAPTDAASLRRLPEAQRWLDLHEREKAVALKSRSSVLANVHRRPLRNWPTSSPRPAPSNA
jgi:hypothetical protein